MKRKGSTTSIVIATIAGLSVLGIAGYRMMAGDCGSCAITGNEVAAVSTATATESDCGGCALCPDSAEATLVATEAATSDCGGCESAVAKDCGSTCSDEAAVQAVSTEAASDCGSACAGDACGVDAEACCGKCDKGQELAKAPQ